MMRHVAQLRSQMSRVRSVEVAIALMLKDSIPEHSQIASDRLTNSEILYNVVPSGIPKQHYLTVR